LSGKEFQEDAAAMVNAR